MYNINPNFHFFVVRRCGGGGEAVLLFDGKGAWVRISPTPYFKKIKCKTSGPGSSFLSLTYILCYSGSGSACHALHLGSVGAPEGEVQTGEYYLRRWVRENVMPKVTLLRGPWTLTLLDDSSRFWELKTLHKCSPHANFWDKRSEWPHNRSWKHKAKGTYMCCRCPRVPNFTAICSETSVFELRAIVRQVQMTPKWHWTLQGQRYATYVSSVPKSQISVRFALWSDIFELQAILRQVHRMTPK